MTSDAASTQPRKRTWKRLIVVLACVVAVVTIALLATPPKPEPVKVWFVRATNEAGVKKLVFEGTNGIPKRIEFVAVAVTGAIRQIKMPVGPDLPYSGTNNYASGGTIFSFTMKAPPKDVPYFVMWKFYDVESPKTRWWRFRVGCCNFLGAHGMPNVADRLFPWVEQHYIPSSEIKE
jgi:hypothetical protein